jgi:hypothetical protein
MPAKGFAIAFALSFLVILFAWATSHDTPQSHIRAWHNAHARISLHIPGNRP